MEAFRGTDPGTHARLPGRSRQRSFHTQSGRFRSSSSAAIRECPEVLLNGQRASFGGRVDGPLSDLSSAFVDGGDGVGALVRVDAKSQRASSVVQRGASNWPVGITCRGDRRAPIKPGWPVRASQRGTARPTTATMGPTVERALGPLQVITRTAVTLSFLYRAFCRVL